MGSEFRKKLYRKRALIASAFTFALTIGLASYASITLAWFTTNRTATVNFASMKVEGGLEASVKYCSYNKESNGNGGYLKSSLSTTKFDADNNTYATLFLDPSQDKSELGNGYFAPLYCSSYVIEVTNPTSRSISFATYLLSYNETVLVTRVDGDVTTPTSYISLARAMKVYTSYSLSTSDTDKLADARSFLTSSFSTNGVENAGVFSHTEAVTTTGTPASFSLTSPESWNPSGTTITIPSSGACHFFISMYFSNDSSTFYGEPTSVTSGEVTTYTYKKSTTGNSNCYQNLSIAFASLLVAPTA